MVRIGELITEKDRQGQQFTLIDVFALMTFVAIVVAGFAPVVRSLSTDDQIGFWLILLGEIALISGAVVYSLNRRRTLTGISGRRLGVAFYGSASWRYWPVIRSALTMLLLAAFQIGIAFLFSNQRIHFLIFMQFGQLAFFVGNHVVNFLWRAYPATIEFFENGVATGTNLLHDWGRVNVRKSDLHPGRIVVVVRPVYGAGLAGGQTYQAHVSAELASCIFAAANRDSAESLSKPDR